MAVTTGGLGREWTSNFRAAFLTVIRTFSDWGYVLFRRVPLLPFANFKSLLPRSSSFSATRFDFRYACDWIQDYLHIIEKFYV